MHMETIWKAAHALRGYTNANEYKDFILPLIFYKYLSVKIQDTLDGFLFGEGISCTYKEACEAADRGEESVKTALARTVSTLGYYIRPNDMYSEIVKRCEDGNYGYINLESAFYRLTESLEQMSGSGYFSDLLKISQKEDQVLCDLIKVVDEFDLHPGKDDLGAEYMKLIDLFASTSGRKDGEYYTPDCICELVAGIIRTHYDRIESLNDPACGSGALLMKVCRELAVHKIYGNDVNRSAIKMVKLNTILNDLDYRDTEYKLMDTLLDTSEGIYQVQVSNPPFSLRWKPVKNKKYPVPAPAVYADLAFVEHMVYHMGEMAVCILPVGVLYRKGQERKIREWLLEQDLVDTVMLLAGNFFYNASTPVAVIVLKRDRADKKILFIDGSEILTKERGCAYLSGQQIETLIKIYRSRAEGEISVLKSMDEITEGNLYIRVIRKEQQDHMDYKEISGRIYDKMRRVNQLEQLIRLEVGNHENLYAG